LLKSRTNRPQDVLADLEFLIQVAHDLILHHKAILSVDVRISFGLPLTIRTQMLIVSQLYDEIYSYSEE